MANFTSMSTGVGQLNYTFATSAASEFSVTVENESAHKSEYRERQIKRIQDRVANKPGISFGRLRSDLHLESSKSNKVKKRLASRRSQSFCSFRSNLPLINLSAITFGTRIE